ncbi:HNH endonuclease [Plantactinospora sp. WMMB782]|uniref:HNH endonuclease n=1 Tax=Plantactinospora sp. WMMB782 TaxID=3404121 RepID=UPI003B95A506
MRRLRLTEGGTIKPLPASVYAAVVASGPCVYCGAPAEHADHVRPVAQGGSDNTGNLVPACGTCNHGKWGKLLTEWDPVRVAHGVECSPVVAVEYARLTGTLVRS